MATHTDMPAHAHTKFKILLRFMLKYLLQGSLIRKQATYEHRPINTVMISRFNAMSNKDEITAKIKKNSINDVETQNPRSNCIC